MSSIWCHHRWLMPYCCLGNKLANRPLLWKWVPLFGFLYTSQEKGSGWGNSGQVGTCGPYQRTGGEESPPLKSLIGKRSRALSRKHWQAPYKCFFFLSSIRKWARGTWIEPLKDQTFKCFFPLEDVRWKGREKCACVGGRSRGASLQEPFTKRLLVSGYLSDVREIRRRRKAEQTLNPKPDLFVGLSRMWEGGPETQWKNQTRIFKLLLHLHFILLFFSFCNYTIHAF